MEKFKDIWKDWYEGKLQDIITGEADTEEIIDFFTGGFVDEIQETACAEVFNLFLDPALEHVEYDKLFKWVLEPFTSQCARKVRRFARKFRKSTQARLAIVFAGSLTCSMLEDVVVDNLVPVHPDKLKEQMSDLVCGGDSEEDCNKKDLLNDPFNCGECKRQVSYPSLQHHPKLHRTPAMLTSCL